MMIIMEFWMGIREFGMGIREFGKRTRKEAEYALLDFVNCRIPPIGNGDETEVPPRDEWMTAFEVQDLRFCV